MSREVGMEVGSAKILTCHSRCPLSCPSPCYMPRNVNGVIHFALYQLQRHFHAHFPAHLWKLAECKHSLPSTLPRKYFGEYLDTAARAVAVAVAEFKRTITLICDRWRTHDR